MRVLRELLLGSTPPEALLGESLLQIAQVVHIQCMWHWHIPCPTKLSHHSPVFFPPLSQVPLARLPFGNLLKLNRMAVPRALGCRLGEAPLSCPPGRGEESCHSTFEINEGNHLNENWSYLFRSWYSRGVSTTTCIDSKAARRVEKL